MTTTTGRDVADDPAVRELPSSVQTVLTADVRGYTRFTQEFGDEAAAKLATKFAEVTREVVATHGGEVVELRGDEALSVFASARQALRSSIDLQRRFARETEYDPALPLRVGIGIDAGEMVSVEGGYRGGALNLAARLSSLAGPGEVLASDVAVRLARRTKGLMYVERGLVELKGFAERVPVIRVLDESEATPDSIGSESEISPANGASNGNHEPEDSLPIGGFLGALPEGLMVARDEEFDRVLAAIQAVEGGSGRLVLLAGEPGVGKTRLAQEVTLKARNHSFLMATGRCYEPEANVPFYPFLEALATLYSVAPGPIRDDLARRWPDVLRLLPNEGSIQTAGLSEEQEEQQRLFWAVTGFIQAVALERPVALLLDDLHWADASSLELLQHLARHTRAHRVLLLGAYRDVEVSRQHPLEGALRDLGRERLVEEIELHRFTERGTAELIEAILGGAEVSRDFVRVIHRQTDGNPFFVEEVIRALLERGDVHKKDDHWEGRAVEDIDVPKSIRSAIGQRLSRLSSEDQTVLQEASVLGPAFSFDDLLRMCRRNESELEGALEDAVASGLVRETGKDSYAFNHALTQSTLYAELPSRKRRRLHLAAGESLEQLTDGARKQRIAELAWHFLEADEPRRAMKYALEAGRAARDVFAYGEAERHYRTALELSRELGDKEIEVKALEGLGGVLRTVARYDEALQILDEAVNLHKQSGNKAGERWTTAHIGRVHALRGTPEDGIERILALLASIEATADEDPATSGEAPLAGLAGLYTALAHLYQETMQSSRQLEAAQKALEVAPRVGDTGAGARIQAEGQMWQASALAELGELEDARRMLENVIPHAEAAGDALVLSRALNSLASVYSEAGQYQKERQYIERALEAAEAMGDPARVAHMNHRLGWYLLVRGEWDEARTYLERSLAMRRALGWTVTASWTVIALAYLSLLSGRTEEGESYLAEGMELARPLSQGSHFVALGHWLVVDRYLREGDVGSASNYLDLLEPDPTVDNWTYFLLLPIMAWTELERGNVDRAADLADEATERATAESNRMILVEALRVQAMTMAREGQLDDAMRTINESIATARAIEQRYPEARSLEVLGRLLMDHGDHVEGVKHFEEALAAYEQLGALPDADRLKSAMENVREGMEADLSVS